MPNFVIHAHQRKDGSTWKYVLVEELPEGLKGIILNFLGPRAFPIIDGKICIGINDIGEWERSIKVNRG